MKSLWRTIVAALLVGGLLWASVAAGAGEESPDDKAQPVSYEWVIDSQGELWVKVTFKAGWGPEPPLEEDFRSFFFSLEVVVDEGIVEVGWELHEGAQRILGSPSQVFILDNGCVVIATGLNLSSPSEVLSVSANFGSWEANADNPIFGSSSEDIDSGSIATGDPLAVFGGQKVFDLATGEKIMPTTTGAADNGDQAGGVVTPATATPEPEPTATTGATDNGDTGIGSLGTTQSATTDPPTEGEDNTEGGSFSVWIPIFLFGSLLVGGFWVYYRTRERKTQPGLVGGGDDDDDGDDPRDTSVIDESPSVRLTDEDLERYREFGIDDHATAQQAKELAEEKATDIALGDAHAAQLEADTAAAIAAAAPELEPLPVKPDIRNVPLTDNPWLAAGFEFVTVMETDLTTGRSRDRLAEVIVAMPDAFEKAGKSTVQQVSTAATGWVEILDNPDLLGTLDEAFVYGVEQFFVLGEEYLEAAEEDDDKFVTMTADIIANAEIQAVIGKGFQVGGKALANRLQGGVAAVEGGAAETATAAGRGGSAPTVRPPPVRSGSGAAATAAPTKATRLAERATVIDGYGPGAVRGPPVSGVGTPRQLAPNGCGAAVCRGIFRDLGLAMPKEIDILIAGTRMGVWKPIWGFNPWGMFQVMRSVLPATVRLGGGSLYGLANKAGQIGQWIANNPGGKIMVGIRWKGAGKGGAGHWVRVEAVRDGWVYLGDPQWASGFSVKIPAAAFNAMAEVTITVVP